MEPFALRNTRSWPSSHMQREASAPHTSSLPSGSWSELLTELSLLCRQHLYSAASLWARKSRWKSKRQHLGGYLSLRRLSAPGGPPMRSALGLQGILPIRAICRALMAPNGVPEPHAARGTSLASNIQGSGSQLWGCLGCAGRARTRRPAMTRPRCSSPPAGGSDSRTALKPMIKAAATSSTAFLEATILQSMQGCAGILKAEQLKSGPDSILVPRCLKHISDSSN